jgi:hypothetical protein
VEAEVLEAVWVKVGRAPTVSLAPAGLEDEAAAGAALLGVGFRRRVSGLAGAEPFTGRCLNWKRLLGVILAVASLTWSVRALTAAE